MDQRNDVINFCCCCCCFIVITAVAVTVEKQFQQKVKTLFNATVVVAPNLDKQDLNDAVREMASNDQMIHNQIT
jgi:hypothetical protein